MSRKKDANKYWIYGEDTALAAQFTAYLATVLKNRRLTYIRHLKKIQKVECSYEYAAETIEHVDSIREESLESAVEAKLMWEAIKPYLHKLSPKECEVMICLYIDRLSIADTATKLKIKPDTVSTHKHNEHLCQYAKGIDRDMLDEIVDLLVETVCSARKTIRIAGDDYPAELVKSKLMKLDSSHIEFVFDCISKNTTEILQIPRALMIRDSLL